MRQCQIYFPGLLGPDVPLEQLAQADRPDNQRLPSLATLFSRGRIERLPHVDIETRILNLFGFSFNDPEHVPMARLRSQLISDIEISKRLWCLDPVHVQIDAEDVVLQAHQGLYLTEPEQQQIIADLNRHFAQDDIKLHYVSAHRWLLQADLDLDTVSLSTALFNPVSTMLPKGRDEKRWRAIINEIQMLLFTHPLNQLREQQGLLPLNSLWLWGGGADYDYTAQVDCVYADGDWIAELAGLVDIKYTRGGARDIGLNQCQTSLIIMLEQVAALKQKDVYAWLDALVLLEQTVLQPLLELIRKRQLDQLVLVSDTVSFTLTQQERPRWWHRTKPVFKHLLTLRAGYAD